MNSSPQASLSGLDTTARIFRRIGFWAGPLLFLVLYFLADPPGMAMQARAVMAVTVWISVWWITEAVPLAVTSLLPMVLFPLLGVARISDMSVGYGHPLVFLYIGGFLLAIAIEKTGLHDRIAISIIRAMGTRLRMIALGFMLATGFLSMWISNTATAVMMLPIGLAIIQVVDARDPGLSVPFSKSILLSIAYAASIGGVATLIGTPPNLVFAAVVQDMYGIQISFLQWFMLGLPLSLILLMLGWFYLTSFAFPLGKSTWPGGKEELKERKSRLEKMDRAESTVALIFMLVAFAWITRSFLLQRFIPGIDDTVIALIGGLILFMLPSGAKTGDRILVWTDAGKLPWGIILLFGGGMALAETFESSGLAQWIGNHLAGLTVLGVFMMIFLVVMIVNFLTEFTSNLATVTMILPVLAPVAISAGMHPVILMAGATLAASCGFMMPAGTPPNAIVFGSGYLRIWDMIKTGFVMNVISVIMITIIVYFLLENMWSF